MTTWSKFVENGYGSYDLRLMIEGWPHEWVTHPRITHATNANGRTVYPGLKFEGLRISQRANLRDGWAESRGMTARIVPTAGAEDALNGFTRDARPIALLLANGSTPGALAADTSWVTRPSLANGVYHIATEAVSVTAGVLTRGYWDTQAQDHLMLYADQISNPCPLYSWPPSMEGRRWFLYAYGVGDSGAGDGTCIARGIVSRPPSMDKDGVSWSIQLESVTRLFEQKIAAGERVEYRIRGIYHSNQCPMLFYASAATNWVTTIGQFFLSGFWENESDWILAVNQKIANEVDFGATPVTGIDFGIMNDVPTYTIHYSSDTGIQILVKDALDGDVTPSADGNRRGDIDFPDNKVSSGSSGGQFVVAGTTFQPPWEYPLPPARAMLGSPEYNALGELTFFGWKWFDDIPYIDEYPGLGGDPNRLYPADRLYLQNVDGLRVGTVLVVKNDDDASLIRIDAIDTTDRYITVTVLTQRAGPLYVSSEMVFTPMHLYAEHGSWADFMTEVVALAHEANLGDTPHITAADCNVAAWPALFTTYPINTYWIHRNYSFAKPTAVKDVLTHEFRATGFMATFALDGRLDVCLLPIASPQRTAAATLTDADIVIPAEGMYGQWPHWQAQADGLVNIVNLKLGYNPILDEFDPALDYQVRETRSIAEHKSGGRASVEIAPKSAPAAVTPRQNAVRAVLAAKRGRKSVASEPPTAFEIAEMVAPYLRTLAEDYAVVTVCVPFTKFNILIGQIVEVTSVWIPDGLGNRGVNAKKAIVVGREWSLDPQSGDMGKLTLWFPRDGGKTAGYTPSGRITAQTNLGGNSWRLTLGTGNALNIAWSESADGNVAKHFAIGDYINVVRSDHVTPATYQGTITAINYGAHTVDVTLTSTWVPSSFLWDLVFDFEATSPPTTRQLAYAWVADTNGQLPVDSAAARQFV